MKITISTFIISITMMLSFGRTYAQEKQIVELLNNQLQKELRDYPKYDSLKIVQPFRIDDKKVLSYIVTRKSPHVYRVETIKREVALSDILSFVKDINVLFETKEGAVTITTTAQLEPDGKPKVEKSTDSLFFTEISEERNNESFRDKMLKAFKKAGYKIESTFWAD